MQTLATRAIRSLSQLRDRASSWSQNWVVALIVSFIRAWTTKSSLKSLLKWKDQIRTAQFLFQSMRAFLDSGADKESCLFTNLFHSSIWANRISSWCSYKGKTSQLISISILAHSQLVKCAKCSRRCWRQSKAPTKAALSTETSNQ